MHMDILQEPFCAEIYRENAVRDDRGHRYHLEWTPGLNPDRKNPFSVATLFGEKIKILVDFVKKKTGGVTNMGVNPSQMETPPPKTLL